MYVESPSAIGLKFNGRKKTDKPRGSGKQMKGMVESNKKKHDPNEKKEKQVGSGSFLLFYFFLFQWSSVF